MNQNLQSKEALAKAGSPAPERGGDVNGKISLMGGGVGNSRLSPPAGRGRRSAVSAFLCLVLLAGIAVPGFAEANGGDRIAIAGNGEAISSGAPASETGAEAAPADEAATAAAAGQSGAISQAQAPGDVAETESAEDEADGAAGISQLSGEISPLATSDHWIEVADDAVYGAAYKYRSGSGQSSPTPVNTWTDLKAALDLVNGESTTGYSTTKPYIILIGGDLNQTEAYAITASKNIVLRKAEGATEKPWDYSDPYINTEAENFELYDGVADYKIGVTTSINHFSASAASKLVLENITLTGFDVTQAVSSTNQHLGGSIYLTSSFTFAGNLYKIKAAGTPVLSAMSFNNAGTLNLIGGVFSDNKGTNYGVLNTKGSGSSLATINITNTIFENNTNRDANIFLNESNGTLGDGVIIRNNTNEIVGAGLWATNGGNLILGNETGTAEVLFENNHVVQSTTTGTGTGAYPGQGGAIAFHSGTNNGTFKMYDGVTIQDNSAVRGAGGISLARNRNGYTETTKLTAYFYGGQIINNTALGTSREYTPGGNAKEPDKYSIGGGGAIYVDDPAWLNFPASSTIEFSGNSAPFAALNVIPVSTSSATADTPWWTSGKWYNLDAGAPRDAVIARFSANNSTGFSAPYDNLYNNYDIGAPSNLLKNSYAELSLKANPASGASGHVVQTEEQMALFKDINGDGRLWREMNQTTKLNFTAAAEAGHAFTSWSYESEPALTAAEWNTAFGGTAATAALSPTITGFTMPNAHVTLTANFGDGAYLTYPKNLIFQGTWNGSYTNPAALAFALENTGDVAAGSVGLALSDFRKDGESTTESYFDISGTQTPNVGASATNSTWLLRPKGNLTGPGAYTARVTLTYNDGAGSAITETADIGFALVDGNNPLLLAITSEMDFGQGALRPAAKPLALVNYGTDTANVGDVILSGVDPDDFAIVAADGETAAPPTGTVAGGGANDSTWYVRPKAGISPGLHECTVVVTYDGGLRATKHVSFTQLTVANLTIADNLSFTDDIYMVDYPLPPNLKPILLTNSGNLNATITNVVLGGAHPEAFAINATNARDTVVDTNSSYLVGPVVGLAMGNYRATLTVEYTDSTGAAYTTDGVQLSFTVVSSANEIGAVSVNITAPAKGMAPATAALSVGNSALYTAGAGSVTWMPNDTAFQPAIAYTASIRLTAANPYKFAEILTATVDGRSPTSIVHDDLGGQKTLILAYEFPATAPDLPGAPAFASAIAGDGQVALAWTAPAFKGGGDTAISSYIIEYSASNTFAGAGMVSVAGDHLSRTITDLLNGTPYYFRVKAANSVGEGPYDAAGQTASPTTATPASVPDAPTLNSAAAGFHQIALAWTAPAYNGGAAITSYRIQYATNADFTQNLVRVDTNDTDTGYTITGLASGTAYYVRVRAENASGRGALSNTLSATPLGGQAAVSISSPSFAGSYAYGTQIAVTVAGGDVGDYTLESSAPTVATVAPDTANNGAAAGRFIVTVIAGSGSFTLTPGRAGDSDYDPAYGTPSSSITATKRGLSVSLAVANKHYDGLNTAVYSTQPTLVGAVSGDSAADVALDTIGTPTFGNAAVGNGKTVNITDFSLQGTKASSHYTLTQPTGITANITSGFAPVRGTHYTATGTLPDGTRGDLPASGWSKGDVVIAAMSGYQVSLTGTDGGAWSDSLDAYTAETAGASPAFYVRRTGLADGGIAFKEISVQKQETYKIDKTAPTAQVKYHNADSLRAFLDTTTFGLLFKAAADVTVQGADLSGGASSGVATVAYYKAAAAAIDTGSIVWDATADATFATFTASPNQKFILYAKVTDAAGNSAIYKEGVTLFTDSAQSTASIAFTKASGENKQATVLLNGNTVKGISNSNSDTLAAGTHYTVSGAGEITFLATYLDTLAAGSYTLTVSYFPGGTQAAAEAGSDAVGTTAIGLAVSLASGTSLTLTNLSPPYTYGDSDFTVGVNGAQGAGDVTYSSDTPGVATVGPATGLVHIAAPGTFKITAVQAADGTYAQKTVESAAVTVNKADPGVSLDAAGGTSYGTTISLAATVSEVGVGDVPTGTVSFYKKKLEDPGADAGYVLIGAPVNLAPGTGISAASYDITGLAAGTFDFKAVYSGSAYYLPGGLDEVTAYDIVKTNQSGLAINGPGAKTYGDATFTLTVPGPDSDGLGSAGGGSVGGAGGAVSFSVPDGNGVIELSGTGNATATIIGAGSATISVARAASQNFNAKTGTPLQITVGPKPVTITGAGAANKPYDGASAAAITGALTVNAKADSADDVSAVSGSAAFASKDAADGITVSFSGFTLGGADAHSYTLSAQPADVTADITKNELTVNAAVKNKKYDGLTTAEWTQMPTLNGVAGTEAVGLSVPTPTFASVGPAAGITINLSGAFALTGDPGILANYTLTQPGPFAANIGDGFTAIKNTHYTVNANDWQNTDFVITAANGYALSTGNTEGSTWTQALSRSAETASGSLAFYVRKTSAGSDGDVSQNDISQPAEETYKIDKTAPTVQVQYKQNGFKAFLNIISFGLFFKNNVDVTIVGADTQHAAANSGVAPGTLVYSKTSAPVADEGAISWVAVPGSGPAFTAQPNEKFIVYSRVDDVAGNTSGIGKDAVVVYTDSGEGAGAGDAAGSFTRGGTGDAAFGVELNGNTVASVQDVSGGQPGSALTPATHYTAAPDGTVTLKNDWLAALAAGVYGLQVSYRPMGESYVDATDNEAPDTTGYTLTVVRAGQSIAIATAGSADILTYGDSPVALALSAAGSGIGNVTWSRTSGSDAVATLTSAGELAINGEGSITVRADKAQDGDFAAAYDTKQVTVQKAAPSVTLNASGGEGGSAVALSATVAKVGGGAVPAGTVQFYEATASGDVAIGSPVALAPGTGDNAGRGVASISAGVLSGGGHSFKAYYSGMAGKYNGQAGTLDDYSVGKAVQAALSIDSPGTHAFGDADFSLATSGGSGSGSVSYSVEANGVLAITAGGLVHITGAGSVTVTATKAADSFYNAATATREIAIGKATPTAISATGSAITYGQALSSSTLSSGSATGVAGQIGGAWAWSAPAVVPDVANSGYAITFTPADTANYVSAAGTAGITVNKAAPTVGFAPQASAILPYTGVLPFTQKLGDSAFTGGTVGYYHGGAWTEISGTWAWDSTDADTATGLANGYATSGIRAVKATFTPADSVSHTPASSYFNAVGGYALSVTVYSPLTRIITLPAVGGSPGGHLEYGQRLSDLPLSGGSAETAAAVPVAVPGSFEWSAPSERVSAMGPQNKPVTFIPDDETATPEIQDSGYVRAYGEVSVTVDKATPAVDTAGSATVVVYGNALSTGGFGSYTWKNPYSGATVTGSLAWASPASIITADGVYGAIFTPDAAFADFYTAAAVNVNVEVKADKAALEDEMQSVNDGATPGFDLNTETAPPYYKDNYPAGAWEGLMDAYADAAAAYADASATQAEVDAAASALALALAAIAAQDHPVVGDGGSALGAPDYHHEVDLDAFGRQVDVEFKGHAGTAAGLSLDGVPYGIVGRVGYPHPDTAAGFTAYDVFDAGGVRVGAITDGSAIVHLDAAYVDTLANGSYTLALAFSDPAGEGTGTATLDVGRAFTITATAGAHGAISPSGAISAERGSSRGFAISADSGYHVADVQVDGVGVGPVGDYTFTGITADHTIAAAFEADAALPPPGNTVPAAPGSVTPDTGDGMDLLLWFLLCFASLDGLLLYLFFAGRRRPQR